MIMHEGRRDEVVGLLLKQSPVIGNLQAVPMYNTPLMLSARRVHYDLVHHIPPNENRFQAAAMLHKHPLNLNAYSTRL